MDHIEDDEDENIPDERDPEVVLRLDSSEASAECPKISELRRETCSERQTFCHSGWTHSD